jgi:NAD(P)-dependent dehydrogenase (short-subunit alcohol dehydrogenase family)
MQTAIVTGASLGLGFWVAAGLGRTGYRVVITSRSGSRANLALEKLRTLVPDAQFEWLELDLAKAQSVNSFAERFASNFGSWQLLVNNAGAKVLSEYSETDSGIEYHFGVNAVGHFAITMDLAEFANPNSRVVSVSSIVARFAPNKLGPHGSADNYSPGKSYAASKLSNLLFALELSKRIPSLSSVAAHPGFAKAEPYGPASTRFFESFLAQTAESGACPIIAAALADDPEFCYLAPRSLELWGRPKEGKLPKSINSERQRENWEILERLCGR